MIRYNLHASWSPKPLIQVFKRILSNSTAYLEKNTIGVILLNINDFTYLIGSLGFIWSLDLIYIMYYTLVL